MQFRHYFDVHWRELHNTHKYGSSFCVVKIVIREIFFSVLQITNKLVLKPKRQVDGRWMRQPFVSQFTQ